MPPPEEDPVRHEDIQVFVRNNQISLVKKYVTKIRKVFFTVLTLLLDSLGYSFRGRDSFAGIRACSLCR
jgi:hypothetical protein